MHIENLKVFCDLVESKSFSRAAKMSGITQSAVSQQLRSIEDQLSSMIVDRSQKQFRLTPEGEIFYRAAKEMLHRYGQLYSDIHAAKHIVSGHINVSTIYSIGLHELPPLLKKFLHAYPQVKVNVSYRGTVYEDIEESVADLGLVAFPQKTRNAEVIPFAEDRLIVICAPSHPLASHKSLALKDLAEHPLIGLNADIPTRRATDHFLHEAKVELEPIMEFDNIETIKRAVEVGIGLAIVPAATVAQEAKLGTLVALEVKGKPLVRPMGIIYRKGRVLTAPMKKFIETLSGKTV